MGPAVCWEGARAGPAEPGAQQSPHKAQGSIQSPRALLQPPILFCVSLVN